MYPQVRQLDTVRREARHGHTVRLARRFALRQFVLRRRGPNAAPCYGC